MPVVVSLSVAEDSFHRLTSSKLIDQLVQVSRSMVVSSTITFGLISGAPLTTFTPCVGLFVSRSLQHRKRIVPPTIGHRSSSYPATPVTPVLVMVDVAAVPVDHGCRSPLRCFL